MTTTTFMHAFVDFAKDSPLALADAEDVLRFAWIKTKLEMNKGNRSRTAKVLGVHRNTLTRTLEEMRAKGYPIAPAPRRQKGWRRSQ